jgi:hypothetical protein
VCTGASAEGIIKNKTVTATFVFRRGGACILFRILSGSLFLLPVILGHLPVLILGVHKRVLARKKVKINFQFLNCFCVRENLKVSIDD